MRLNFYSIHDTRAGVYIAPFVARSDVEAVRQLRNSLADPQMANSPMVLTPSDFFLTRVGSFDDESGAVAGDNLLLFQLSELGSR